MTAKRAEVLCAGWAHCLTVQEGAEGVRYWHVLGIGERCGRNSGELHALAVAERRTGAADKGSHPPDPTAARPPCLQASDGRDCM
jgi:hypothetical protein